MKKVLGNSVGRVLVFVLSFALTYHCLEAVLDQNMKALNSNSYWVSLVTSSGALALLVLVMLTDKFGGKKR